MDFSEYDYTNTTHVSIRGVSIQYANFKAPTHFILSELVQQSIDKIKLGNTYGKTPGNRWRYS